MKIVLLERNSAGTDVPVDCFYELGEVTSYPNTVTVEEVAERVGDADVIVCNKAPMREESLKNCPNVKLICELATGYDNCDLAYCKSRGIKVANVVDYSTAMVAQHTFTLALALSQKLPYYDEYVKDEKYVNDTVFTHFAEHFNEISGKTWGIIGLGTIGRRVADIAKAFGARVIYYSASGSPAQEGYEQVDFDTLLSKSDIVSVHAPLNEYTKDLMNKEAFAKMKKTAIFLNLGRGPIVVEQDLCEALENGEIAAAGLDVLCEEPMSETNPLVKIKDSRKLIITPHIAWASVEARTRLMQIIVGQIKEFFAL